MEPNRNSNNNGGDEHEQLQKSERKRTFNELTNDEDKPAAGEEDPNCTNSKKNREEGKDLDLEVCILQYINIKKEKIIHDTEIIAECKTCRGFFWKKRP
jgi:hypothetical protein